jgi:hypothetical protein
MISASPSYFEMYLSKLLDPLEIGEREKEVVESIGEE